MPDYGAHFARLAANYDGLRAGPSDEAVEALVRAGDLGGRRVLDVGCGTGRLAEALTLRYGAAVTGVDPSEEMLEVARNRMPAGALRRRAGSAEDLPFDGGVFERAVMQVVAHLVDRRRALPEIHRVLGAGGRLVIATVDPTSLERYWLGELFPSYVEIDRRRFPEPRALVSELEAAGFAAARWTPFDERKTYGRDEALGMIRGRFASSFALMDEDEYRAGLERAERELPTTFESALRFAIVTAYR